MEQKPTVGRVVHYLASASEDGEIVSPCRAAMVADVRAHGLTLTVFVADGKTYAREGCQQSEGLREGDTWHWPERA